MDNNAYLIGGLFKYAEYYYDELVDFVEYISKGEVKTILFHEDYCYNFCKYRPHSKYDGMEEEYWDKECFIKIAEHCYKKIVETIEEIITIMQEYTEEGCIDIIRKTVENIFKSRINEELKEWGLVN